MTKQANKKEPAKKTFKRKSAKNRNILLGSAFLVFLTVLIVVGLVALISPDEQVSTVEDNKPTSIAIKAPADKKLPQADVTESADNIAVLIRLVLYDYEIARSAVEERTTKTPKGKITYHFRVKIPADHTISLRKAVERLLKQKGYSTKISKTGELTAESNLDGVKIAFIDIIEPNGDAVKQPKKDNSVQKKYPSPPASADVVVKMAILLDDAGANLNLVKRFVNISYPVGAAVLPHLQYSQEAAKTISAYGKNVFLHFPMEPKSYPTTDPGEGAVLVNMPELLIEALVKKNFENLGIPVDGFNNHMGSALTEDKVKMAQIFASAAKYTNSFVDSRTTSASVAYDECVKAGLKCGVNKKFIDNDNDVNAIIIKIYEGAELAKKNGEVLLIGHMRQHTLDALEIALPILQERKITIVPVTSVVR